MIIETWHWRMVKVYGTVPMQRTSHTAVVYQDSMYVFAGYSGEKYLNDMFRFDFGMYCFLPTKFPILKFSVQKRKRGTILPTKCKGKCLHLEVDFQQLCMVILCMFLVVGKKHLQMVQLTQLISPIIILTILVCSLKL